MMNSKKLYEDIKKKNRKEFLKIIKNQEKEIEELFEEIALELENEYSKIENKEVDKKDLSAIFLVINRLFKGYDSKLYEIIYKNMVAVIDLYNNSELNLIEGITDNKSIIKYTKDYTKKNKEEVIEKIIKGLIYKDLLSLKKRCNSINKRTIKNINRFINDNCTEKIKTGILIKKVVNYINPKKNNKKCMNSFKRAARTTLNHTFREILVSDSKENLLVEAILWELSPDHFVRMPDGDICDYYAENDLYGLGPGIFPINEVPYSHPNCLCSISYILLDDETISAIIENH